MATKTVFVLLYADTIAQRLLRSVEVMKDESFIDHYPESESRPATMLVQCRQVEATAYGLVRLGFGDDGRPPAVEVRASLLAGIVDAEGPLPVGFLNG